MNNHFYTETDESYVLAQSTKVIVLIYLVLSALACLGFLISWKAAIFFEVFVLVICWINYSKRKSEGHNWRLYFKGDFLTVLNVNTGHEWDIYDIPASNFIINQSRKEKKYDYCSISIKQTIFHFGGVKNYHQLKAYIEEHYQ